MKQNPHLTTTFPPASFDHSMLLAAVATMTIVSTRGSNNMVLNRGHFFMGLKNPGMQGSGGQFFWVDFPFIHSILFFPLSLLSSGNIKEVFFFEKRKRGPRNEPP